MQKGCSGIIGLILLVCSFAFMFCVMVYGCSSHEAGESKLEFKIPQIRVVYYGGQDSGVYRITTFKPTGCRSERVIAAFNKVGIPAAPTTTHAEKECIDIPGEHPFEEMIIDGNSVTIIPNLKVAEKYPRSVLEELATEIRWAH